MLARTILNSQAVHRRWPHVLLQWEDFSKTNARRLLDRYRDHLCTFNDDIQGTGAVTLAGLLTAVDVIGQKLADQRVVILGAGSAATGIADQLIEAMVAEGATRADAAATIWMVDSQGLVHTAVAGLDPAKRPYAQPASRLADWDMALDAIPLETVVRTVRPTILIGVAAQPGSFSEALVREMADGVERPIIFPLSNPTSKSEAVPADLLAWTEGRAIVATGSPFAPVTLNDTEYTIGQCNNSYVFPGVGLGILASGARHVTNGMFVAAARALSALSPMRANPTASLYPPLEEIRSVSRQVALAVAQEAQRVGLAAPLPEDKLIAKIERTMWTPHYRPYCRAEIVQ
jgi:malate dehydrogenase (oxaloacetate-decarboxylating)